MFLIYIHKYYFFRMETYKKLLDPNTKSENLKLLDSVSLSYEALTYQFEQDTLGNMIGEVVKKVSVFESKEPYLLPVPENLSQLNFNLYSEILDLLNSQLNNSEWLTEYQELVKKLIISLNDFKMPFILYVKEVPSDLGSIFQMINLEQINSIINLIYRDKEKSSHTVKSTLKNKHIKHTVEVIDYLNWEYNDMIRLLYKIKENVNQKKILFNCSMSNGITGVIISFLIGCEILNKLKSSNTSYNDKQVIFLTMFIVIMVQKYRDTIILTKEQFIMLACILIYENNNNILKKICEYKNTEGKTCRLFKKEESNYCKLHTCSHPKCENSKQSRKFACEEHASHYLYVNDERKKEIIANLSNYKHGDFFLTVEYKKLCIYRLDEGQSIFTRSIIPSSDLIETEKKFKTLIRNLRTVYDIEWKNSIGNLKYSFEEVKKLCNKDVGIKGGSRKKKKSEKNKKKTRKTHKSKKKKIKKPISNKTKNNKRKKSKKKKEEKNNK